MNKKSFDHKVLVWRVAYFSQEVKDFAKLEMSEKEWLQFQLNYLEKEHRYFTETAKNIRLHGKKARMEEMRERLKQIED